MEGLAPLLIIIISIISALAKSKKNKIPAKRSPSDAEKRMQEFKAFVGTAPAQPVAEKKEDERFAPHWEPAPAPEAQPAPARIGTEGEDACHEYMLPTEMEQDRKSVV